MERQINGCVDGETDDLINIYIFQLKTSLLLPQKLTEIDLPKTDIIKYNKDTQIKKSCGGRYTYKRQRKQM